MDCKEIEMTSANSIHEAGHAKLVLWDNPEGWGGEGGGRGIQNGSYTHMYTCGGFISIFSKTNTIL